MTRPSFDSIFMDMAVSLSQRATCERLHVGCVITSQDKTQVYSIGYNGNAHGLPNTCDSSEPGRCGCLHAEENACIHCAAPREALKIVYVTVAPCKMCAKRIVNLGGVVCVKYVYPYRLSEGIDVLEAAEIKTRFMVGYKTQVPRFTPPA